MMKWKGEVEEMNTTMKRRDVKQISNTMERGGGRYQHLQGEVEERSITMEREGRRIEQQYG